MNVPAEPSDVPADATVLPVPAAGLPGNAKRDPLRRQRAVVAMGRRAIAPPDPAILLEDAAALLAEVLDTDYSAVAELLPDRPSLRVRLRRLRADGKPSEARVRQSGTEGSASLAGYVLQVAHPVAVADLRREDRFVDPLLREADIRSVLAVPLKLPGRAFGALAACSTLARSFDQDDLLFAETVAHLVVATMARNRAETALANQQRLEAEMLQTIEALVLRLDAQWRIVDVNAACQRVMGFALNEIRGRPIWSALAAPEDTESFRTALEALDEGIETVRYEGPVLTKHAKRRLIAWSCRATFDRLGGITSAIVTGIDRTEQRAAEHKALQAERQAARGPQASGAETQSAAPLAVLPLPINAERRRRPRRSYPYTQLVGFVEDGKLPDPNRFIQVRCNDIAAGGFSFLSPMPPPSDELVIGLGIPPKITYLTAQVAHVTRTEYEGQRMYLVGCTYTGRAAY